MKNKIRLNCFALVLGVVIPFESAAAASVCDNVHQTGSVCSITIQETMTRPDSPAAMQLLETLNEPDFSNNADSGLIASIICHCACACPCICETCATNDCRDCNCYIAPTDCKCSICYCNCFCGDCGLCYCDCNCADCDCCGGIKGKLLPAAGAGFIF